MVTFSNTETCGTEERDTQNNFRFWFEEFLKAFASFRTIYSNHQKVNKTTVHTSKPTVNKASQKVESKTQKPPKTPETTKPIIESTLGQKSCPNFNKDKKRRRTRFSVNTEGKNLYL